MVQGPTAYEGTGLVPHAHPSGDAAAVGCTARCAGNGCATHRRNTRADPFSPAHRMCWQVDFSASPAQELRAERNSATVTSPPPETTPPRGPRQQRVLQALRPVP